MDAAAVREPLLVAGAVLLLLALAASLWWRGTRGLRLRARLDALARESRWAEVVALANDFENRTPPEPLVLEHLANALLKLGNLSRAERVYRRALKAGGGGATEELRARVTAVLAELDDKRSYEQSVLAFREERWSQAARGLQKLAAPERFPQGALYLAMCFVKLGQADLARQQLKTLDVKRLEKSGLYRLGICFEEAAQLDDAKGIYESILLHDVGFKDVRDRLETVKRRLQEVSAASAARSSQPPALDLLDLIRPHLPERYELKDKLGMGGMGVVVRALDRERRVDVAIKVLSPVLAENPELKARFVQESTALTRLEHPNIIRVFEVGAGALPYYVMEYLDGKSLREYLEQGILPLRDTVYVALQVTAALAHAHGEGVVHRDVKPDNIVVDKRGLVKLVDFGLAKFLDATAVTKTDALIGTQLYMAPEQIQHGKVEKASDLYALGATLYHLVCGAPPFVENPIWEHVNVPAPDPAALNPHVGPRLRKVILKCLEKDPGKRYRNCWQLEQDLKESLREASTSDAGVASVLLSNT